jgi:hypothetical protein
MGTTSGGLFQYGGQPVGGMIGSSPFGDAYFVDYEHGSDSNTGKSSKDAFKTLSAAIDAVTTNNNDVIYIDGNSAVVETSMVTLSKNRVTIVGVNGVSGHYGQGARVYSAISAGSTNIATMQNTGVRNTFIGIKFDSANTVAESLYGFAEGGEFSRFFNCHFYKSTDLDESLAAELLLNGDSAMFYNCTWGSTVDITADAKIRPNVLTTRELITGKACRDVYFENCLFLKNAGGNESKFIYGVGATSVERYMILKDCTFLAAKLSAAAPDDCVGFSLKQTDGLILLKNCTAVNCTKMALTDMSIWVDGGPPTEATTGVALEEVT